VADLRLQATARLDSTLTTARLDSTLTKQAQT